MKFKSIEFSIIGLIFLFSLFNFLPSAICSSYWHLTYIPFLLAIILTFTLQKLGNYIGIRIGLIFFYLLTGLIIYLNMFDQNCSFGFQYPMIWSIGISILVVSAAIGWVVSKKK